MIDLRFLGNVYAVVSACGSSVLQVIWKNATKKLSNNQRTMLIGLVGLCNILFGWPILVLLHFTKVESLNFLKMEKNHFIESLYRVSGFVYAGLFGMIYTLLIQFGTFLSKETFLHIGSLAALIISFGLDIRNSEFLLSNMRVQAFASIIISYILLILPPNLYMNCRKILCPEPQQNIKMNSLTRRYRNTSNFINTNASPVMSGNRNGNANMSNNARASEKLIGKKI